jgi:hypothetical protein
MVDFVGVSSTRRWLFPILALLLVLGHACELPAYADLVGSSRTAEGSHHSADGHGDEHLISCDAAVAASGPSYSQAGANLGVSMALSAIDRAPVRMVARSFEDAAKFSVRPPLFLLYASLLI